MSTTLDTLPHRHHGPARGATARDGRAGRRRRVRPADRAGRQAARRRDRADARLQRLDPGPDAEGARRARRSSSTSRTTATWRRPSTGTGCGSRTATTGPTRPRRPMPVGEQLHGPRRVPRPGALLVPPAHPRGLRPGDGPVRQHPRRARRSRLLAAGAPRARPHARRHPARGRQGRAVQPRRRRRYAAMGRFGDVLLVSGETEPLARRAAGRGRSLLPDEHRQHARVQGRAAGRADEAGRRRQRPRRARGVRRATSSSRRRSAWSSTCSSSSPASWRSSTAPRSAPTRSPPSRQRGAGRAVARASSSRRCATNADMVAERERIAPYLEAEPDKTLAFVAEMDMGVAGGRRPSSTPARCTRRSSARSRPAARSAA